MAAFDWLRFLREQNIDYVTRGASTSRNNVNVRCPICADADNGHHMGVSLKGKGWHCWLNEAHSGKSRVRLIQLLLRCDEATARSFAGMETTDLPRDRELGASLRAKLGGERIAAPKALKLLPQFRPLMQQSSFAAAFRSYLRRERHYPKSGISWIAETFDLHYCISGPFAYRIIIPIYDQWHKVLNWTARTIVDGEELRYRALGNEAVRDLPAAKCQPQQALLGLPYLWRVADPKVLLVVEGPFDAMWLNLWGHQFGVHATCLFGLNLSEEQMDLLSGLQEKFPKMFMLLDKTASLRAFKLAHSGLRLQSLRLDGAKDPAELPPEQATTLCLSLL